MRCVTRVFYFSRVFEAFLKYFSRIFTCVFDTNMLVFKTQVKTREKLSIVHHALGKNVSQLRFFSRFGMFKYTETQTQRIVQYGL